ncbi:DUF342 domain-containing protein [Roseomonas sp. AR75]|uniref:DUF342 domain-containing protein n=1 Tax=Roseomonas sp. AR75 TaxID=2562311 RepID=UPI0010C06D0D|nr:DUF342 domain-containing protein [Roseomonas sp. AR75]
MADLVLTRSTAWGRDMQVDGDLTVDGNLTGRGIVVTGDVTVTGDLHARGSVQAGGRIKVGKSLGAGLLLRAGGDVSAQRGIQAGRIESGGGLRAGADIAATGAILACGGIAAGGSVEAGAAIMAGEGIRATGSVFTPSFAIDCQRLATRQLPFGREYWAALPMLAPWRERILDTALCWDELRAMFSPADIETLCATRFGHWSLEAQFRMFLGAESAVVPPEASRRAPPAPPRVAIAPPAPPKRRRFADPTNVLLQIVNNPAVTPFPDYTGNASYAEVMQALAADRLLLGGMDLRAAYPDLAIELDPIYTAVSLMKVRDAALKQQLLVEIAAAGNVRSLKSSMDSFVTNAILADDLKIQFVGDMVRMADNNAVTVDVGGILSSVVDGLSALDGAGTIFTVLGAVIELADAASGGFPTLDAAYNELVGKLSAEFAALQAQNGAIAQALLTDWGKLSAADALIADGTLAWPVDDSAAATAAANLYEIGVFQALLPVHWQPIFSYYDFARDTRDGCNGTVWMQPGGWGAVDAQQQWVPYWMTFGQLWTADLSDAEQELAKIGVSIQDLTMGTGLWGPAPFAYAMAHPVGVDERPSCVKKK